MQDTIVTLATRLLEQCRTKNLMIATAESCTGGLIAGALTEVPGSSDVFERGFVTYSNEAKAELLGVEMALIEQHGAVSEDVARAMAVGAVMQSNADLSVAVTGVAGPGGGSAEKPVGLVHIAAARRAGETAHVRCEFGDPGRTEIRNQTVQRALELLIELSG